MLHPPRRTAGPSTLAKAVVQNDNQVLNASPFATHRRPPRARL